jgi:ligand-binding sensor domain-containing protein
MDYVGGILASRDGTIYVANGDALDRIGRNGAVSSIRWGKGLPGDQVFGMLEDRAGNLWVGSGEGRISSRMEASAAFRNLTTNRLGS